LKLVLVSKKNFAEDTSRSFDIKVGGQLFQGFVIRKNNQFFAYQNLCQHLPVALDLRDNQFFTHDKKHLQCHMHGATYDWDTGLCVAGPCEGQKLVKLNLREEESNVVVSIPGPEIHK
jgi:nitrite reductase/ring-hydroxylating ferredoxin subunit